MYIHNELLPLILHHEELNIICDFCYFPQDIVATLEKLHFPQEWRILFTVSGVPPAALDDVEATRSLINLVYDTMDGNMRPEDVPKLNLNSSGEDQGSKVCTDFALL